MRKVGLTQGSTYLSDERRRVCSTDPSMWLTTDDGSDDDGDPLFT
jgi:hypothetical protein